MMPTNVVDPYKKGALSGQLSVASSGTVDALPDVECTRAIIRPLPGNAGAACYLGSTTGTLSASTGLPLASDDPPFNLEGLQNLNELNLFVIADGDGIGFLALHDPMLNPLT